MTPEFSTAEFVHMYIFVMTVLPMLIIMDNKYPQ